MVDRQLLIEYLDLLVMQAIEKEPYLKLFDSFDLCYTIEKTNDFIEEKLLGITNDDVSWFMFEAAYELAFHGEYKIYIPEPEQRFTITNTEELADFMLEYCEALKEEEWHSITNK